MSTHELKTWPEPFDAIMRGEKVHELRRNDRGFKRGDMLILREWNPATEKYTGEHINAEVTHVTEGGCFGLPLDMCVMSIMCMADDDGADPAAVKASLLRMVDRAADLATLRARLTESERKCEEMAKALRDTADALDEILSSDSDMPTHMSTYGRADEQLEKARAFLAALSPPAPANEPKEKTK